MRRRYQPLRDDSLTVLFPVLDLPGRLHQCRTAMFLCEKLFFLERKVVLVMPCTFELALVDWCETDSIFVLLPERVRLALPERVLQGQALLLDVNGLKVTVKASQPVLVPPVGRLLLALYAAC